MSRPEPLPDGDPESIVRRAPFSENPRVGVRGQQAQQRILDAALTVFGEEGYHGCGIVRITEVAGCSRSSFYQYFSSKEDVFRHLSGQVARQLMASAEALAPITADQAGWDTIAAWVDRHAQTYERYEPVFQAFQAAAESDEAVASGSTRIAQRNVTNVRARVVGAAVPARQLDGVIGLLISCMTRTHSITRVLRAAGVAPAAGGGALADSRVQGALTDLVHRSLFGRDDQVNVHPPARAKLPGVPDGTRLLARFQAAAAVDELTPTGSRTLDALLEAGQQILLVRGYHGTRVDDITDAAGVSHGAFYRYFDNKDDLVRMLAARAVGRVSASFAAIPDIAGRSDTDRSTALRRWLREYLRTHAAEGATIRLWVEASAADPTHRLESAAALDWGRGRLDRFLRPRRFGDVAMDALLMLALVDVVGSRHHPNATIEAAAEVVERGLLGAGHPDPRPR